MIRQNCIAIALLCAVLSGCSPFQFTNLVNETTPIPGTTATFTGMGSASFDGTNVALVALRSDGKNGVYTSNFATPNVVANIAVGGDAAAGPGTAGTYSGFINFANFPIVAAPSIHNGVPPQNLWVN